MFDTVLHNASIQTMDAARPRADWLAIRGGRIAAIGQGAPPDARRRIDAGGRLVLPGFLDAHNHLLSGGVDLVTAAQLYDVTTLADLAGRVAAHARANPELPVVLGAGWTPGLFGDENLTAAVLDAVVPDRPVVLYDNSYHNACLNSRALAMAGIGDDTPDPPNGHILRNPDGTARGMLHEDAIQWAVTRLPQLTDDHWMAGLRAGQAHANRHGLTGVLDPRVTEREAHIYDRARRAGDLTLWVNGAALVTEADTAESAVARLTGLRAAHPGPEFHIHSAKFFMDGVFENRTAALLADYADQPGNAPCMFGADQTRALFTALDAARFAIHVHVIGDGAVRRSIEGLEAARAANGPWPAEHQLAHLQLMDPADYARLAGLATANIQPLWARTDPVAPDIALEMIGARRRGDVYAFRKMLDHGADFCLSSDWSVTTLNPFEIIETAITRQARRDDNPGPPFLPDQALTVAEAVEGYTVRAARAMWRRHHAGQLRPGFSADLIVLDRDILTCPADEISQTRVLLTLFRGAEVWRDPGMEG